MEATVRLEHQLLAVEAEHTVHAMLELTAPAAHASRARPPLHLALVIDRSGSMAGPKLQVTKECAAFLVRRLAPTDELALIAYDDEVRLITPLLPVHPEALLPVIATIPPGGSTNLSGGWLKGMEVLKSANGPGARKVLLLTDGLANVGITEPSAIASMARRAAAEGVGTTTIGFGAGFNEDLLTAMADAGGGNAHYAATPDEAPRIFSQEFEDLVGLVAQNLSVEIRPSEQVKMLGVLNEYPAVEVPGGLQVQLGDAYAEDRRRVVFELHVPEMAALGVTEVAKVVVRYVSVGEEIAAHEVTLPITVNLVSADEAAAGQADRDVVEEVVILKAARAQENAMRKADAGEFEDARSLLEGAAKELRMRMPESAKAAELLERAENLEGSVLRMSMRDYTAGARKRMHYDVRSTHRRRKP